MGVHDRDWYQEHWRRNVLGVSDATDDPAGEPVRARRLGRVRAPLPAGAESGSFWSWVALALLVLFGAGALVSWLR